MNRPVQRRRPRSRRRPSPGLGSRRYVSASVLDPRPYHRATNRVNGTSRRRLAGNIPLPPALAEDACRRGHWVVHLDRLGLVVALGGEGSGDGAWKEETELA